MSYRYKHFLCCILAILSFSNYLSAQCEGARMDANYELLTNDICEGELIPVTNTTDQAGNMNVIYIWDWGDGTKDTLYERKDTTHIYIFQDQDVCSTPGGEASVSLRLDAIVPDCPQLNHFVIKPIFIKLRPEAQFTAPEFLCTPELTVDFANQSCSPDPDATYLWDFGDPASGMNSSTEFEPSHTFSGPGSFNVRLTMDGFCGIATFSQLITVYDSPEADATFEFSPLNGCTPVNINLRNRSRFATNFDWNIRPDNNVLFINDTDNLSEEPEVRVTGPGTYIFQLKARNICGEDVWADTLELFEAPTVDLQPVLPGCESVTVNFGNQVTYTGSVFEYRWTFENGEPATSTEATPSGVVFNTPGSHQVIVEAINDVCGSISDTIQVVVQSRDAVTIQSPAPNTTFCTSDDPITFSATPVDGQWSGPGVNPEGVFNPASAGVGRHTIRYQYGDGVCSTESEVEIEVFQAPGVSLAAVAASCETLNYTPDVNYVSEANITTYRWTFENASISSSTEPFPSGIVFNQTGLAIIEIGSSCGLIVDTAVIEVEAPADLQITPPAGAVCNTSSPITLEVSPSGGSWSGTAVTAEGVFDPAQAGPGMHDLTYNFVQGACNQSEIITLEVLASAAVTVETDVLICEDGPVYNLDFTPFGGTWSGSPGIVSPSLGQFDPQQVTPGDITLTYTFPDANGCVVTRDAAVTVQALPTIGLPADVILCRTDALTNLPVQVGLTLDPAGGTTEWTGPGIIDAPNGIFKSTIGEAQNMDRFDVLLTYMQGACTVSDELEIILEEPQTAAAGDDFTICVDEGTVQLIGTPAGGRWAGPAIDAESGEIDLQAAGGGDFTYTYTFSPGTSCEVSDAVDVNIIDLSGVDAGDDFSICQGADILALSGFMPVGGVWRGPGVIDSINGLFDPSLLQGGEIYSLEYTVENDQVGCAATDRVTVNVFPVPSAAFDIIGTTCLNEPIVLENNSLSVCSYQWDFGDGASSTDEVPTHTYTVIGDYTITLTITSCDGCIDVFQQDVSVTIPPSAAFTPDVRAGCAVLEVNFENESLGVGVTYNWDFGDGRLSDLADPGPVLFEQGRDDTTYVVTLTAINGCGSVEDVDSITVFPKPIVDFGTDIDDGCSPLPIRFANVTAGNPDSYFWDLGNGVNSRDSIPPDQKYTTSDSTFTVYTVSLIATNECGTDTLSREIVVNPNDVDPFFNVDTTSGCQPLEVNFTNFSTPGAAVSWNFGDGNFSNQASAQHIYDTLGTFTVYQYVNNGCSFDTASVDIRVFPAPEVSFTHQPTACIGERVLFQNTSPDVGAAEWDFGDGTVSLLVNPEHAFDSAGIYEVILTVFSSSDNCPSSISSTIEILPNPVASFVPSDTDGCLPFTVCFTNTSQGAAYYEWDFGNGEGSVEPNPCHTYFEPGNFSVTLKSTDANGCFTDIAVFNVQAYEPPSSAFSPEKTQYCDIDEPINLINQSQGAAAYEWDFGDGNTGTQTSPIVFYADTGRYDITLIALNAFGCSDTTTQTIGVNFQPVAFFGPRRLEICERNTFVLENTSLNADRFLWDFGDGNTSTDPQPAYEYDQQGAYDLKLVVSYGDVCYDSLEVSNAVRVIRGPIADFTWEEDPTFGPGGLVRFMNRSVDANAYFWDFGDGEVSQEADPRHEYEENGDWEALLVAFHPNGCTDTTSAVVSPGLFFNFSAPNAFSPESGIGDVKFFKPAGIGIAELHLQVFSPWGELLWESQELDGEQPGGYWDGMYKGAFAPQGAYAWKAAITYVNGLKQVKMGSVILLR